MIYAFSQFLLLVVMIAVAIAMWNATEKRHPH